MDSSAKRARVGDGTGSEDESPPPPSPSSNSSKGKPVSRIRGTQEEFAWIIEVIEGHLEKNPPKNGSQGWPGGREIFKVVLQVR